jgi:hypothetical protein
MTLLPYPWFAVSYIFQIFATEIFVPSAIRLKKNAMAQASENRFLKALEAGPVICAEG